MQTSTSFRAAVVPALFASFLAAGLACDKTESGPVKASNESSEKVTPGTGPSGGAAGGTVELTGAGATFPYPLYSKWISEYEKVNPRSRINYQSIGSGGGIKQITERTVDFGASDAPLSNDDVGKLGGAKLHHIPTTLGAVVIGYNVAELSQPLVLDADTIAGIFLGDIKTWNDPKIAALNSGVKLPASAINVAYRSDGSGTTAVFTDYLARISPAWKDKVGAGKSVKFPVGLGAKGNEGVAGSIKTTPGTIGYVELAYAKQTGMSYAHVKNQAGKVIDPTPASITAAAAASADSMPETLASSIVNATGDDAYPIAAYTYILVYEDQRDPAKGKALADFLWWAVHDGQKMAESLHYAALPDQLVTKIEAKLRSLSAAGKPLLQ